MTVQIPQISETLHEKQHIFDIIERRRATPTTARHFLTALNSSFN